MSYVKQIGTCPVRVFMEETDSKYIGIMAITNEMMQIDTW